MKGAFLVSDDPELFAQVRDALVLAGATAADDVVQFRDESGHLVTVFGDVPSPSTEWELREGPFVIRGEGTPPRMETATGCWVECRSERAFSLLVRTVAAQLSEPAWVLDGDGVLWPASRVDPDRLRL